VREGLAVNRALVCEAEVLEDGSLRVNDAVRRQLRDTGGGMVTIHVVSRRLSEELRQAGATLDEIERIRSVQMEEWDSVARCLLAEGRLSGSRRFAFRAGKGT
jgi:hypothetical protein